MDEMTLMRGVRASEPGPSVADNASAREALLAAIDDAARSEVQYATRSRVIRLRTTRRRTWVPAGAATAAVITGLSLLALASGGPGSSAPPTATRPAPRRSVPTAGHATLTAAFVLRKAAAAAASQAPASGRYFFTESEYIGVYTIGNSSQIHWQAPTVRRFWLGNGVPGRLQQPLGSKPILISAGVDAGNSSVTWAQLRALPTSAGPLRVAVERMSEGMTPKYPNAVTYNEFGTITDLLVEAPAPPALRAALYRLAATLPGITLITGATDLIGRYATEVYLPPRRQDPPNGQALFFDPSTGNVLGWAQISDAGAQCPPRYESAILVSSYVNSAGKLPPGTPRKLEPARLVKSAPGCPTPGEGGHPVVTPAAAATPVPGATPAR